MQYLDRITLHPEICHGKPCLRGMRWPVEVILDLLSSGMSVTEILEDFPELTKEDIWASLNYAKLLVSGTSVVFKQAA
ncbi:MAG: hypothetical protein BWK78_01090 [Thiotrichaceae bacterium IS1]|nr:MAG: hypothetical protein BWK78_01090 [Thiotrichaceae bacterium IS1]